MRILHLVHQYPPHFIGGTELYTQTLAKYQALAGHDVSVFCPYPDVGSGENVLKTEEGGVQVFRVGLQPRSRSQIFFDSFRQAALQSALKNVLIELKPDLVHIQHLMGLPIDLINHLATQGIPSVLTLHDYWYVCANAQLLTNTNQEICNGPDFLYFNCARCALARAGRPNLSWLAPAVAPLMGFRNRQLSRVLQQASEIIAPTHFVKQIYTRLGASAAKMVVIKHGLELPEDKVKAAREKRRNKQAALPLHIGYIGGISRQKGLHVLVEAVNGLAEDEIELTIYGDLSVFPDYVQELRHLIRHNHINLVGSIAHEDIWPALAEFDVIVLPTLWYETSSLILDEAFAAGVPVIATRLGVMEEKIEDDVNGRLFPVGDIVALREVLKTLVERRETVSRWRHNIPEVQTIEAYIKEIEDVYHEVLHGL